MKQGPKAATPAALPWPTHLRVAVAPPGTLRRAGAARGPADGARLRLLVRRDPARNDVSLRVEAASHPAGPWQPVAKTVEVRDVVKLADAPRRFLRVAVLR